MHPRTVAFVAWCSVFFGVVPLMRRCVWAEPQAVPDVRLTVRRYSVTGTPSFVTAGAGLLVDGGRVDARAEDRARAFLRAHGESLRLPGPNQVRALRVEGPDEVGMDHVRLQQIHEDIPVTAGELSVHLRGASVVAVHATTVDDVGGIDTVPTLTASEARATAGRVITDAYGVSDSVLGTPRLEIFNRGILEGRPARSRLAWSVEGTGPLLRAFVWVDAHTGAVLLTVNQVADALNREIYDGMSTETLPGTFARSEGAPATGDPEVDAAYDYTGDTYDYFLGEHGRDSYDGAGGTMRATVRSCPGFCECPCWNAYWNGLQTIFGSYFATMDDIVGHEWTHGVTDYTANLIYYRESGALSESYSDIFGETIDLSNGAGRDTPEVRWGIGEDLFPNTPSWTGFRNMMDPGRVGHPGKMSDPLFVCTDEDDGGVHSNSGVGNHAYALMVDGGTYNGYAVTGIGLTRAGKIHYRALSVYLGPASQYANNYDALNQSCADLIGTGGITTATCVEVTKALDAVEMASLSPCGCSVVTTCMDGDGCCPPGCDAGNDDDCLTDHEFSCQQGSSVAVGRFFKHKLRCIRQCARRARNGINPTTDCAAPYGGDTATCIARAEMKTTGRMARKCGWDCPECYAGGDCAAFSQNEVAAVEAELDRLAPDVYCDDAGSPDQLTGAEARCQDMVARKLGVLAAGKLLCMRQCRTREHNGRITAGECDPPPADAKTSICIANRVSTVVAQIEKRCGASGSDAPECYAGETAADWAAIMEAIVDEADGRLYCGSPSAAFLSVAGGVLD